MNRKRSTGALLLSASIAAALIAVLALVASGVMGAAAPKPSQRPPGSSPSAPPASRPSLAPSDDASDGIDVVDLGNAAGVRSSAIVWDESDTLADASSGPGNGASVAPDRVRAVHVDDDTIHLIWTDLPIDNRVRVSVRHEADGRYLIRIVRATPRMPTAGVAADRVLVLDFHVSVPAEDLAVDLVDSLLPSADLGYAEAALGPTRLSIWDETQGLSEVLGQASRPEASVGPNEVRVSNVGDPSVVRLVWTDSPAETHTRLSVRIGDEGRYKLRLVRTIPQEPTDIAWDREVVLGFHVAVPAESIDVELIDTLNNG